MDDQYEEILLMCLESLERGESPDEVLAHYPEHGPLVRTALSIAVRLSEMQQHPSPIAQERSKQAMLREADRLRAQHRAIQSPRQRPRWYRSAAIALVLVFAMGGNLVFASQSALPGETLYGMKRVTEDVAFAFTWNDVAREQMGAQLEQKRRDEVTILLRNGLTTTVSVRGALELVTSDMLVFTDLPVQITPDTHVTGALVIGRTARITGFTWKGVLIADTIIMESESIPLASPVPPAPPASIRPTHQPTRTLEPVPTTLQAPMITLVPIPTSIFDPTMTPEAVTTAIAAPTSPLEEATISVPNPTRSSMPPRVPEEVTTAIPVPTSTSDDDDDENDARDESDESDEHNNDD